MIRIALIALTLIALVSGYSKGQDINLGAKFGFGFTKTEFTPETFSFSTVENESAYIYGIKSEKIFQGPIIQLEYKAKNRFALDFSLNLYNINYEFDAASDAAEDLFTPAVSTDYWKANLGISYELIQNKFIRPYLLVGGSYNGLLAVDELDIKGKTFSDQYGREVRNAIMLDYLTQQNASYFSVNAGIGFKVYNFFLEGIVDRNITEIDKNGAYPEQYKLFVNVGVNLLRFDLAKKQRYEN